jgi:hypothetical protein
MARKKSELVKRYEETMKAVKEARKEAQKVAAKAINEGFADIFAAHPNVNTLAWPQYTPYFNDGDPCEFGVRAYAERIEVNGYSEYEQDNEDLDLTEEEFDEIVAKVEDFVNIFDDDDLQAAYGEGLVIINRDGTTETDYYEHD